MSTPTFALRGEHITLEGLIKAADLAGMGSVARALIADGAVAVDGTVETRRGRKLRGGELVALAGEQIRIQAAGDDTQ
ncbi:RNA-binding S4 domain-containing protein [Inhella sp.]|uniref:RNA-binding S4 domain-containing protein n=1 Tax=Inhella sp. TaxID=1921806 RepID=UPI0035AFF244